MRSKKVTTLIAYVVRGGDGSGTALFGYAWTTKGKLALVRASGDGCGQLIVQRFEPSADGRRRAHLVALAVRGTVKRVVRVLRTTRKPHAPR
jgi:hypothetical protein